MLRRFFLLGLFATVSVAQTTTPNTSFHPPPVGALALEAELSGFDAVAFHRDRIRLEIPGRLRFFTNMARISYAPTRHIAVGAELPYRIVEYRPDLGGETLRHQGAAGTGLFVDLVHHPADLDAIIRIAYFRAAKQADPVVTASDGINRYSAAYSIGTPAEAHPFVAYARLQVFYASSIYFGGSLHFAAGRRIKSRLDLLAVATYARGSEVHEEGTFLENQVGYSGEGGLLLQWRVQPAFRIRLSATHTFGVRNGLDGTRVTLSAARSFRLARR